MGAEKSVPTGKGPGNNVVTANAASLSAPSVFKSVTPAALAAFIPATI